MKKYTEKKIYEFTMDYIDSNPLDICEFFDAEDIAKFVSKFLTKQDARLSGYSVKLTHYCNGECALSVSSFEGYAKARNIIHFNLV